MLKKYFIPHEANDYKPHSLREVSVIIFLVVILLVFVCSSIILPALQKTSQTAAIYSAVIVETTNKDRQETENLGALEVNPLLVAAAQAKADDMASKGYFAHNSPDGRTPWSWLNQVGYPYLYAGENLAINFSDSDDVVKAWMNSPGHRANILNHHYTEIGVAMAKGEYEGKKTIFVVQMFGSQKAGSVPQTSPTVESTPAPSSSSDTNSSSGPDTQRQPVPKKEITPPSNPPSKPEPKTDKTEETFVATDLSSKVEGEAVAPVPSLVMASTYEAPWYEKLLVNPSNTLKYVYLALFALIVIFLILYIFIERKIQHPKNVSYGILLLLIMIILYSIHWIVVLSSAAIQ